jgi:hypothetical protein
MVELENFSSDSIWYAFTPEPDNEKRTKEYYLKNVRALYFESYNNFSLVGFAASNRIAWLRAFSEGRQFKPVSPDKKKETKESSLLDMHGNRIQVEVEELPVIDWNNELWDILSPANKIMTSLIGNVTQIDYEINADPLDYATQHKTAQEKLNRWVYSRIRDKVQGAAKQAGIQMPEPNMIPESPEDLDLAEDLGEFTVAHVKYIEQIVKHTFDISHWSPDIKTKFYRDIFVANKACVKNEYDPEDGKVKPTYIDIQFADTQKSIWPDCWDNERGWHYYTMPLSTLRQYFPDKPEEWFQNVAKSFCGEFDNPGVTFFNNYTQPDTFGAFPYDNFKVAIGNYEWVDINTEKWTTYTDKKGRKHNKQGGLTEKDDSKDKTIRFKNERMRYGAKWVLGTDEVFEWGPSYETTYPSKNDTELTYKWIVLDGKSITEQLIPIYKNFEDLWEKFRKMLRDAQGKGYELDIDQLASTRGEKETPSSAAKKAFRQFLYTGRLFKRSVNAAGTMVQNRAIQETEGGMGLFFNEILEAIKTNISMVEYITGLNPLSMGQTPNPNAPVKTSELAYNATAATLRPYIDNFMRMQTNIAENAVRWITCLIRGNEYSRDAYKEVVGEEGIQAIIAAQKDEASYGINLTARPNEKEKALILQDIEQSSQPDKNGDSQISIDDKFRLINMVMSGSPLKTIQSYFTKAVKKQREAIQAQKKDLMDHQSQLNDQNAQQTAALKKDLEATIQQGKEAIQELVNQGGVQKAAVAEGIKREKEKEVARIKAGEKEPESTPAQ